MAVDQLPGRLREFVDYLDRLLTRLDPGGGWCAVFWQRDPDGMRACLEGREVPPWDVVEALLQDLAVEYGPGAAAQEQDRARALHLAALADFDARPGGRDALGDRLDVMLREQRYAAERQAELGRLLASAATQQEADAIRLDLAWARDDHERATARCAELRSRMADSDRRTAGGQAAAISRGHLREGAVYRIDREFAGEQTASGDGRPGEAQAGGHGSYGSGDSGFPGERAPYASQEHGSYDRGGAGVRREAHDPGNRGIRRDSYAPEARAGSDHPYEAAAPGTPQYRGPFEAANQGGAQHRGPFEPTNPTAPQPPAPYGADFPDPAQLHAPQPSGPVQHMREHAAPEPAPAESPAPEQSAPEQPAPKQRKRRRGSARFAGMAEEEAAPVVVPPTADPTLPTLPTPAAGTGRNPRGARFAGAAEVEESQPQPEPEPLDAEGPREVAGAVRTLVRLRTEGRTGEAHALLVEAAYWPAARFPLLAAGLQRAGLGADWATLLWEAASLPADKLVAAADALVAAGRGEDGEQILRQGVARPAGEIGRAVLGLAEEGRRREVRALLDAYVRVRTPEEAARSAEPDPQALVPLLLEAAQGVSDERHWDLVHALRVAGFAA
ncbi:hypothetical protein ACFY1L_04675 [Streptomyces sp. NPDC001663]|uniref:hypothetical protein n=1 Tax=Streptomyces sp. NPDC001663 TaxID=3364597 RepID=UPI00369D0BD5